MASASVHFAAGALGGSTCVLFSLLFRAVRKHIRRVLFWAPVFATCCGLFALVPDVLFALSDVYVKGHFHKPIYNIFFLHAWLDIIDNNLSPDNQRYFSYFFMGIGYLIYNLYVVAYMVYIINFKKKIIKEPGDIIQK